MPGRSRQLPELDELTPLHPRECFRYLGRYAHPLGGDIRTMLYVTDAVGGRSQMPRSPGINGWRTPARFRPRRLRGHVVPVLQWLNGCEHETDLCVECAEGAVDDEGDGIGGAELRRSEDRCGSMGWLARRSWTAKAAEDTKVSITAAANCGQGTRWQAGR
jgi:hypothetical protein